ncbi:MAG: AsmA family protein [Rhizobiaceae bacterium]|nr:AsmA family protein [Rhizobiaceae bacterium]
MTLVRLFVFFGGLLAMALFAILLGPYFIDWSEYRADFERESSRILGQEVEVRGEASMRLLPFPSVTFNDLAIGKNKSGQPLMTAKQFEMDLELTPFLSGEILIFDMRVEEPKLTVTLFQDGSLDWALNSKKNLGGRTLVLESVQINNGQIKLVDLQNRRTKQIENINTILSAPEISGPWHAEGNASFEDQNIEFEVDTGVVNDQGSMRLRTRLFAENLPLFIETEGSAKIEDHKPSYEGNFNIQKRSELNVLNTPPEQRNLLTVQMKGGFKVNNEQLEIPEYRLASGNPRDPYIIEGEANIDTGTNPEFLVTARGQQIDISQFGNENADTDDNQSTTGFSSINRLISQIPKIDLPGKIDLTLPAILSGNTTVREVFLSARPNTTGWTVENFAAKLPGRTDIEAQGNLKIGEAPEFAGNILIATKQPSGFSSWLIGRVDPSIRQLAAAGISANVLFSKEIQRLENLELILGNASIRGYAERQQIRDLDPSISIGLNGSELDLDKLNALLQMASLDQDIDKSGGLFGHNIIAQLNTDVMRFGKYSAEDVKIIASWEDKDLTLDSVRFGNFSGVSGTMNGTLNDLDQTPKGQITFNANAEQADGIFKLLKDLSDDHPVLKRFEKNLPSYDDLVVSGELSISDNNTPQIKASGTIGKSAFDLRANGQTLMPTVFKNASSPLAINLTAKNPQSQILLAQMGFDVLPFDFEEAADLNLKISRGFDEDLDVDAKFTSGTTNIDLDGFIDLPSTQNQNEPKGILTLDLTSVDIEPLLLTLGQNLPGIGAGQPVELAAGLIIDENNIEINDLVGNADGNKFNGTLIADRTSLAPSFKGDLSIDRVDTEWLYELALGVQFLNLIDTSWSTTDFLPPFEMAPVTDINIDLKELSLPDVPAIQNVSAKLTTEAGIVEIEDVTGSWLGGDLAGNLSISNPDGKAFVSLDTIITNTDVAALNWHDNGGKPLLDGTIDIAGNLEGTGTNLTEVIASMNGGGIFNLKGISVNGFEPDILSNIFEKTDAEGYELQPEIIASDINDLLPNGEYKIAELAIPFTVTGGVQRIASITLENEGFNLTGAGRIDLVGQTISSSLDVLYDAGLEAQAGATPEYSIDFEGELANPSKSINANAMSNFLSIRAYERERRRVELLQASILEKQALRREIALVKDQQLKREEEARLLFEEQERIKAEEAARIKAEEEAKAAADAEAQRIADEAIRQAQEAASNDTAPSGDAPAIDWQKSVEELLSTSPRSSNGEIVILPLDAPSDQ